MLAIQAQARGEGCCDGGSAPDDCCNPATATGRREMMRMRQAVQTLPGYRANLGAVRRRPMTPRQLYDKCCEPYHPCCDELITHSGGLGMFGADPSVTQQVTQSIAERVAAIRAKMISLGIPIAVGTGAVTTLAFAGAFGLAHSERVWAPSIWLGAVATVAGLVSVAMAAKVASDTATQQAAAQQAATPAPVVTPAQPPAAFGYAY